MQLNLESIDDLQPVAESLAKMDYILASEFLDKQQRFGPKATVLEMAKFKSKVKKVTPKTITSTTAGDSTIPNTNGSADDNHASANQSTSETDATNHNKSNSTTPPSPPPAVNDTNATEPEQP